MRRQEHATDEGLPVVSRRWFYLFTGSITVALVFALAVRMNQLGRFLDGQRDAKSVGAVVGLCWLLLVFGAAAGLARSLFSARRLLHRREQTIAAMATMTHDWLWESDVHHVFTYCSAGAEELLGFRPEELIGSGTDGLLVEGERDRVAAIMCDGLAKGTGWEALEAVWLHRDGHAVPLYGSAVSIHDQSGRVIGFRGTRVRVTDAVQAERVAVAARGRLETVLATSEVDIALQPIVSLRSGSLAGVEALARFRDGRGPDAWFRDARDAGLAQELDELAFNAALNAFSALPGSCYLSVNASPALITDSAFAAGLLDSGLPLDRLVIEITEHVAIVDYDLQNAALKSLRERGVRLAVDDTGAGFASLSHVLKLRPDIIKVDRSLIEGLAIDPARRSLVTALVLLARDIGATVTGEGVEEVAELDILSTLGVDHVQGYLLARPTTDPTSWQSWTDRNWLPGRVLAAQPNLVLAAKGSGFAPPHR
jgi:PAS domain S-box-containing protein